MSRRRPCHTGAVGIVCAWLGAAKVLLTDGSPIVLETTSRNLKANRASRASLQRLRWGYDDDLAKAQPGSLQVRTPERVAAEIAQLKADRQARVRRAKKLN